MPRGRSAIQGSRRQELQWLPGLRVRHRIAAARWSRRPCAPERPVRRSAKAPAADWQAVGTDVAW